MNDETEREPAQIILRGTDKEAVVMQAGLSRDEYESSLSNRMELLKELADMIDFELTNARYDEVTRTVAVPVSMQNVADELENLVHEAAALADYLRDGGAS